jgi:dTDP-glucose pyrophosphorylase
MTAFVILAAGKATRMGRMGENLHKAVLPVGEKAVITRLFNLMPSDARPIVVVGDRAEQIQQYVRLAHPDLSVTWVYDPQPRGPGASLRLVKTLVGDDHMVFTSCDTLWKKTNLPLNHSWVGVSQIPAGTEPQRWCRVMTNDKGQVLRFLDKIGLRCDDAQAYVGLAFIHANDIHKFWRGIVPWDDIKQGETQVTSGLEEVMKHSHLMARHVTWEDVGDEESYRRTVRNYVGYDWTKVDQATYIVNGHVIKYHADPAVIALRRDRATALATAVPPLEGWSSNLLSYRYVQGRTAYEDAEIMGVVTMDEILKWYAQFERRVVQVEPSIRVQHAMRFYRSKTTARIDLLSHKLGKRADSIVNRVDFDALVQGVQPIIFHGDLNYGNIIIKRQHNGDLDRIFGIDWRESFIDSSWGDMRYDVAKLLTGVERVHWGRAQRGDFTPWEDGADHAKVLRAWMGDRKDIEIIGALSMVNSAPLHDWPLDEVLVDRACAWLEDIL